MGFSAEAKCSSLCAEGSHIWGDSSHGCSLSMMGRTNNCKPSMRQSQLLARAYDHRFYCHFTFVYWGRISSSKSTECFLCEVNSNWKIKVMIESKDEHQLIILYRHIIFKGVLNLDHCFQSVMFSFPNIADVLVGVRQTTNRPQ